MRNSVIKLITLLCLLTSTPLFAADLLQVYQQALISDPAFQAARATYLSETQAYPIARAVLLPNIQFIGSHLYNRTSTTPIEVTPLGSGLKTEFRSLDLTFNATQSIIDFGKWANLHIAKSTVKAAAATFAAAEQDLILRTAEAYFKILDAEDNLRFTQAEKKATARQLDQAEQRFKVGLDAITSVHDARAEYDANVAQEIAAKNDVVNAREELREITGKYYKIIAPLQGTLPLAKPRPANVEHWVDIVDRQNLDIIAARFNTMAARENIKLQFAGHLPVVNAIGDYEHVREHGSAPLFKRRDTVRAGIPSVVREVMLR